MNFLKGVAASAGSYVQAAARFNFDVAEPGQQIDLAHRQSTGDAYRYHCGMPTPARERTMPGGLVITIATPSVGGRRACSAVNAMRILIQLVVNICSK